jgi:hypothetical protein
MQSAFFANVPRSSMTRFPRSRRVTDKAGKPVDIFQIKSKAVVTSVFAPPGSMEIKQPDAETKAAIEDTIAKLNESFDRSRGRAEAYACRGVWKGSGGCHFWGGPHPASLPQKASGEPENRQIGTNILRTANQTSGIRAAAALRVKCRIG